MHYRRGPQFKKKLAMERKYNFLREAFQGRWEPAFRNEKIIFMLIKLFGIRHLAMQQRRKSQEVRISYDTEKYYDRISSLYFSERKFRGYKGS